MNNFASFDRDSLSTAKTSDKFDCPLNLSPIESHVVSKDKFESAVTFPIIVEERGPFLKVRENHTKYNYYYGNIKNTHTCPNEK